MNIGKHIEKDPALERRFQPDETIQILKGLRGRYEIHHKLRYTDVQRSHLNVLLPFLFILPILFIYAGDQTSFFFLLIFMLLEIFQMYINLSL
ncbi:hypothetical protein JHK82_023558 [Glycine max]|nr:hypothetical protein JHK82_023558 [Glycine max]